MRERVNGGDAEAYLRLRDLWKSFGAFVAVEAASLDVERGELVCVLGPSGCGKTTLLRLLAGLETPDRGQVIQDGADVTHLPPAKRDFGIVFQSYALFPNLTAAQNIAYGLESRGGARAEVRDRVRELLALVGMPESGDKYPAQLSGGQQQRVALARSLALSPGLLLLDEPLSALDAAVRASLRNEVRGIQRRLGVTTIMVTHDQTEALTMADRIVVMDAGRIVQVGSPHDIYWQPATPFVAGFVGVMNWLPGHVDRDGRSIRCGPVKVPAANGVGARAGDPVVLAVRPEAVRLAPVAPGADGHAAGAGVAVASARVRDVEFHGGFYRVSLEADGVADTVVLADVSVEVVRRLTPRPGDSLAVALPHDHVRVYAGNGGGGDG